MWLPTSNANGAPSALDGSTCPGWLPAMFCITLKYHLTSKTSHFTFNALFINDEAPLSSFVCSAALSNGTSYIKDWMNLPWKISAMQPRSRILLVLSYICYLAVAAPSKSCFFQIEKEPFFCSSKFEMNDKRKNRASAVFINQSSRTDLTNTCNNHSL